MALLMGSQRPRAAQNDSISQAPSVPLPHSVSPMGPSMAAMISATEMRSASRASP
jgi:hypothetical protein